MKKVVCIILSVILLISRALNCFAFADGDLVIEKGVPSLPDTVNSGMQTSQLTSEQRQAIIDKAIDWYFPNLVGYAKTCAKATLSAALKLYEEKKDGDIDGLQYFLKSAALSMRSLAAASGTYSYSQWRSSGNTLLSLNKVLAENGVVDGVVDWDQFSSDSALTAVSRFIDPDSGKEVTEERPVNDSDVTVSSDVFKEFIDQQNTTNTPKGKDLFIQSYQSNKFWFSNFNSNVIPIFNDSSQSRFNDLYLVPFCVDKSGVNYFSNYQYHIYYVSDEDPNADIALMVDIYMYNPEFGYIKQDSNCKFAYEFLSGMEPLAICLAELVGTSNIEFGKIDNLDDFSNGVVSKSTFTTSGLEYLYYLYSSDGASTSFYNIGVLGHKYSYFSDGLGSRDCGYVCSHSMIERTYKDIDTTKIPPNQIINITGDTIYDYSITNPDTGASTTINEYVTNNYYYPEVPSTSEPSGGSGDVNVGGNITVGGEVGVDITVSVPDININVNQGSGAGGNGTGINPDDILDGSSVDLDKYYDDAISQASGVRSFLTKFFDFLPAEIVALLALLIAVAIVCRLFGR